MSAAEMVIAGFLVAHSDIEEGEALQRACDLIAILGEDNQVIVPVPEVGHKGPCDTDASAMLQVAWNLDRDYPAGGSNVRRAVSELLRSVAHAATDDRRTTKERRRAGATA
ncbi:hypothetical protein ACMTN4_07395 [Rhodococcus globerulus]|uniref:hypothetical protein n=1 Tax=Rhodococcus globerulus TaxID=33008 RepID=UPI0039ED79A3